MFFFGNEGYGSGGSGGGRHRGGGGRHKRKIVSSSIVASSVIISAISSVASNAVGSAVVIYNDNCNDTTMIMLMYQTLMNAFLFTTMYAMIETAYRQIYYGKYTTFGQTLITFLWSPFIVLHFLLINDHFLSVVLFPFNIWLCEVIFGYLFLTYWNMRFWNYNDKLTFFNGIISLYFGGYWFILGIILHDFFIVFPYSHVP